MGNVDLKQEQRNIQTWGREYIQVDLEQSYLVFSEKIMHLYWLHVYTTVFFAQRTVALSSCWILWSWSMVHRGKKLLSNRSADVFGMLLFSHQFCGCFQFQDFNEHLSFPDGAFFQLGKKVPEKMMGLLRMQPELKVYRTDWFHWLEYLKTDGIFVLGHCGEVRGVPIRWRLFAVWWAQNLAFQHDIGLICRFYFFLSVWCQLFFWNLPAILGTMFWVWSPDFETRLSRDSETDSKRKLEMPMALQVGRMFDESRSGRTVLRAQPCSKQEFDWSWQTSLACHSWSALQCVICQRHCLRWTVWSHWVCRWTGKVSEGSFRHVWLHHSVHAAMPQTLVLKMGWNAPLLMVWCQSFVFSAAKSRPKQDPVIPKRPAARRWNEWFVAFTGAPGEMCWRCVGDGICWISEMFK